MTIAGQRFSESEQYWPDPAPICQYYLNVRETSFSFTRRVLRWSDCLAAVMSAMGQWVIAL
jgi:hypothetical protein